MRHLAVLAFSLTLVTGVSAEPMTGENLLIGMPTGYKIGFQDRQGAIVTTEMVPEKESSQEWTEMLTTQIYIGLKSVSPEQFQAESKRKWLEACNEGKFAEVRSGEENGYPFSVWMLSCPYSRAPGRPEITWFKAVRGNDSFYVVQKASRFDISREQVEQWMRYLKTITVCDSRIPERPCPKLD